MNMRLQVFQKNVDPAMASSSLFSGVIMETGDLWVGCIQWLLRMRGAIYPFISSFDNLMILKFSSQRCWNPGNCTHCVLANKRNCTGAAVALWCNSQFSGIWKFEALMKASAVQSYSVILVGAYMIPIRDNQGKSIFRILSLMALPQFLSTSRDKFRLKAIRVTFKFPDDMIFSLLGDLASTA